MKILKGKYKGKTLQYEQANLQLRPVTNKIKESYFSTIESYFTSFYKLRFLDLFCGSISMSLEALSQNFAYVCGIELDKKKNNMIFNNLNILNKEDKIKAKIYFIDVIDFVKKYKNKEDFYDVIYIDPPFPFVNKQDILIKLSQSNLIKKRSMITIHHPIKELLKDEYVDKNHLILYKEKVFGFSKLNYYIVT